ncbi:aminotransferase class IV [Jidongwangia harbinensis]|uniref:aminotransferase class IV n=1 Tax=Jidongwangia harbinensis TaxID=2878561 RepID=UPI001CD9BF26|nr:aminotransferase class IV [Jidongwangia harbinensis]MCA2211635.1 aminotransferase class IV [Jidongwangia harbinensis]
MAELDGAPAGPEQLRRLALSNYGHFTTMTVADGRVRGLSLHLERLVRDCRTVFDAALDPDRVRHHLRHALRERTGPVTARVTIFDPDLDIGHLTTPARPAVLVTLRPAGADGPPLLVRAEPYRRDVPAVKHAGLFGPLLRRRAAQAAGYHDAIFTTDDGTVLEGATWNAGFVDGERVLWPDGECLPGVTAEILRRAYPGPIARAPVRLPDLPRMAAAFATNAVYGVRPIAGIDDVRWPADHPVLAALRAAYRNHPAEPI